MIDQWIDVVGLGLFVEVVGEFGQGIVFWFVFFVFYVVFIFGGRGWLFVFFVQFGDVVGQVIDYIQLGDILLVEVVDGVGVFFVEDGDQYVGVGDFFFV